MEFIVAGGSGGGASPPYALWIAVNNWSVSNFAATNNLAYAVPGVISQMMLQIVPQTMDDWTMGMAMCGLKVHGNSLGSLRPTWGYKLFDNNGTFLKNGITSRVVPESRYYRSFMSDKYMETVQFPNRLGAYQWEALQNMILRGPLNLNGH